ncbi:nucleoside diphosphate kinase homolog 7 [Planococcus citri]|uniref:nucleoside diphosphate kinase homolog 7 n=1 Tax=Planococcus citri TaxID=170843 RepID=UPI0031F9BAB6
MDSNDRLTFSAEWKDTFSSVNWKFNLFFYPSDETVELYDLLKHRLFLKRTKCGNFTIDDFYIGASLRICSRLITIKDYADSYTRKKVEITSQKSCGFIKPDLMHRKGEVLQLLESSNFKIINLKMVQLPESLANTIFEDYEDQSILTPLIEHVTSGPVLCFQVLNENSVIRLLDLAGPEDPKNIIASGSDALRARFGADKIRNGIYVSTSAENAHRDALLLFSPKESPYDYLPPVASFDESFCCVIKPHTVKEAKIGQIMMTIEEAGYQISGVFMVMLSTEQAEQFHEVYKYVVTEYQNMVSELCSSPCVAMEVRGRFEKNSHSEFRKLAGPFDPELAKELRPDTIRARFGKNCAQNAIHVTDLVEDCPLEVEFFFKKIS